MASGETIPGICARKGRPSSAQTTVARTREPASPGGEKCQYHRDGVVTYGGSPGNVGKQWRAPRSGKLGQDVMLRGCWGCEDIEVRSAQARW